jgi:molybdopterin/thiamine biosynthesis adenylyltransferase
VGELAERFAVTSRDVAVLALENGVVPLRYLKNIGTVGLEGQSRLLRARAVVIGAGGIGGRASELLARMGVGRITLVDPDVFDETNLNRQGFSCEDAIGLPKVDIARDRLNEINCDVEVEMHRLAAGPGNLPDLLSGADVVIDALDNLDDRLALQEACRMRGVVMVHGAIAGTCVQATTVFPGDPGLEALHAPSGGVEKARGIEVETGNPATTPTLAAVIQVQEALKVILGTGETLRRRLLYLDLEDWTFEFIEL